MLPRLPTWQDQTQPLSCYWSHVSISTCKVHHVGKDFLTSHSMSASSPSLCLLPFPLPPPTVYPVVNMSVTTSGSQAMILCEAYGYPALTDVTILGGTSISNISPQDNFTSWGRASSTQPLMGCPTTFQCKATNGFGATTIQTMACSGVCVCMFT